ncbi:hypothetical protein ACMFMG_006679 [Clarireedia jacksonii]
MPRGKSRGARAGAAQGRQKNTRPAKKQRMEEVVVVDDEEPPATPVRNSKHDQQLRSIIQSTDAHLIRNGRHTMEHDECLETDELASNADCQIVSSLTHQDNHRSVVHRPMTRSRCLVAPFDSGDVYIALADRDSKHTYRLSSTILSVASPWFRNTLDVAPAEVDHNLYSAVVRDSGVRARYGLIHSDLSDIPILKRNSITMYEDELPPRNLGTESFIQRSNKFTPRVSIKKHTTTSAIKPSSEAFIEERLCSITQKAIHGTTVSRSQNRFGGAMAQLDGATDYLDEVYQDARGTEVENETTPRNCRTSVNRSSQNLVEQEAATSPNIKAEEEVEEPKINSYDDSGSMESRAVQLAESHTLFEDTASRQLCDAYSDMSKEGLLGDRLVEPPDMQPKTDMKDLLPDSQILQEWQSIVKEEVTESQFGALQPNPVPTHLMSILSVDGAQVKQEGDTSAPLESHEAPVLAAVKTENGTLATVAPIAPSLDISTIAESEHDDLPKTETQEEREGISPTTELPLEPPSDQHSGEEVLTLEPEIDTLFSASSSLSQTASVLIEFSERKIEESFHASSKIDPVAEAASKSPTEQPIELSQKSLDAPANLPSGAHDAQVVPNRDTSVPQATNMLEGTSITEDASLFSHSPPLGSAAQSPSKGQCTTPPQTPPTKAQSVTEEIQEAAIVKPALVVDSDVLDAYHFLFQTYYNISPAISATDTDQAVDQAGLLAKVASLYLSLPVVRPHICYSLLSHGRGLHNAILQNPPRFLLLSLELQCAPIFREAIIHIVGQAPLWPWPVPRDVIPDKVLHLIETKIVEFKSAKDNVKTDLFTSCLAKGNSRITISTIDPGNLDTWIVVQMWHDWFCGALRECNTARQKQGKVIEGNMYRLIARGGDSYLKIEDVLRVLCRYKAQPGSSEWGNWERKEVEEDLKMMKEYAAKAVKDLVANRAMIHVMGGEGEGLVEHLTCVTVGEDELPWVASGKIAHGE